MEARRVPQVRQARQAPQARHDLDAVSVFAAAARDVDAAAAGLDLIAETHQRRLIAAFRSAGVTETDLGESTGYGYGDLSGDGRPDILDKDGWWEQPKDYRQGGEWKQHKVLFAPEGMRGGAQMLVYDVNGDKLNDVISGWDAHGYGLAWYEQTRAGGVISFKEHLLVNTKETDNPHGVKFTQIHSLTLVDMNGDGLKDFVTGKRFWAHGPAKDAEPAAPAVIYWFELKRKGKQAEFIPHLVDDDSGVGTQITAGDVNGDGKADEIGRAHV